MGGLFDDEVAAKDSALFQDCVVNQSTSPSALIPSVVALSLEEIYA